MIGNHKYNNIKFTNAIRESYLLILDKLVQQLNKANLTGQAEVVMTLVDLLLKQQNDAEFVRLLNSVDMWGGSGAVWEVYIEANDSAREFELEIIKLIDLMEKTNVLGKGIKQIRKYFVKKGRGVTS